MDTRSVELFSENDEETNGGDWYSCKLDYIEEDEPNSAPLSKKQPCPCFFSEKGCEDSRSRSRTDSGYYEEWLKRRGNLKAPTHHLDDAQTPSARPQSHVIYGRETGFYLSVLNLGQVGKSQLLLE